MLVTLAECWREKMADWSRKREQLERRDINRRLENEARLRVARKGLLGQEVL